MLIPAFKIRNVLMFITGGCLAVSPVKISGVDAGFQGACDRVGPSLDVGFEELLVQLLHGVHAHLKARGLMEN